MALFVFDPGLTPLTAAELNADHPTSSFGPAAFAVISDSILDPTTNAGQPMQGGGSYEARVVNAGGAWVYG